MLRQLRLRTDSTQGQLTFLAVFLLTLVLGTAHATSSTAAHPERQAAPAGASGEAAWSVLAGAGDGPGRVSWPLGVAVDARGNVYVADTGNARVQKLSATGQPLAQWSIASGVVGEPSEPGGVAVDADGNIY